MRRLSLFRFLRSASRLSEGVIVGVALLALVAAEVFGFGVTAAVTTPSMGLEGHDAAPTPTDDGLAAPWALAVREHDAGSSISRNLPQASTDEHRYSERGTRAPSDGSRPTEPPHVEVQ